MATAVQQPAPPLATVEDPAQMQPGAALPAVGAKPKEVEEDPKAALKKGVEETEEQILFSCNICYDVRGAGTAGKAAGGRWCRPL